MDFLKKVIIIAVIIGALYLLMGFHYIVINSSIKMLKKSELTLKYTFFSIKGRSIESVLSIEELWEDGIGDLLVEEGVISQEQLNIYSSRIYGTYEE